MTDPDSILQLGIEAAREGNKEEARNLFRLLVSEDANNVDAWLWLAGVSEDQAERQAALEKVLELDPHNEMAAKGLQAFDKDFAAMSTKSTQEKAPPSQPTTDTAPSSTYDEGDFDDPFAELDALSDVFAGDSQAVGRPDSSASASPESQKDSAHTSSASSTRTSSAKSTATKSTATSYQRSSGSSREKGSKKPMTKLPVPSGINLRVIALVLAVIIVFMGLIFVVKPMLFDKPEVVIVPVTPKAAEQQQPTMPPADMSQQPTMPPADQPVASEDTTTGDMPTDVQPEQPVVDTPAEPVAPPPPAPASGLTIIPPNNPLASNGWLYDFNQFVCGGNSCAAPWRANIGSYQAKGRFVIVLMMVVNNTGQDQPVPADFIVVKDAQNRTYNTLPQVSSAYVTPGVNADRSHEQPIPANGIATSVALVFDVPLDATDLVLYAPSQPSQGWLILQNVQ